MENEQRGIQICKEKEERMECKEEIMILMEMEDKREWERKR